MNAVESFSLLPARNLHLDSTTPPPTPPTSPHSFDNWDPEVELAYYLDPDDTPLFERDYPSEVEWFSSSLPSSRRRSYADAMSPAPSTIEITPVDDNYEADVDSPSSELMGTPFQWDTMEFDFRRSMESRRLPTPPSSSAAASIYEAPADLACTRVVSNVSFATIETKLRKLSLSQSGSSDSTTSLNLTEALAMPHTVTSSTQSSSLAGSRASSTYRSTSSKKSFASLKRSARKSWGKMKEKVTPHVVVREVGVAEEAF